MADSGLLKELEALVGLAEDDDKFGEAPYEMRGALAPIDDQIESKCKEWLNPEYSPLPELAERLPAVKLMMAALVGGILDRLKSMALFRVGSPIEELFFFGLVFGAWKNDLDLVISDRRIGQDLVLGLDGGHMSGYEYVKVTVQPEILGIHPDFLVSCRLFIRLDDDGQPLFTEAKVAVELDGHDFHEKTKEQARRDKKRDRDLLGSGVEVVRFTGSEIHKEPMKHALWVLSHLKHRCWRPSIEARLRTNWAGEVARLKEMHGGIGVLEKRTGLSLEEWAKRLGRETSERKET